MFEENQASLFPKDIKNIRDALKISPVIKRTLIICVAIHKNEKENTESHIPLKAGLPIEGYVYNHVKDAYVINCCGLADLGEINVCYMMSTNDFCRWKTLVPMPERVIRRYLSSDQLRTLARFKANLPYNRDDLNFEYIQMVSSY